MKMQVEFEDMMDIKAFVKAWAPAFQVETALVQPVQTEPVQRKKKTKQKEAAADDAVQNEADTADVQTAEEETADEQTADEEAAAEEKIYKIEEIRAVLAALNKAGKRAEVKELLASFGVDKLSKIPQERYGEVMAKAGEL